MDPLVEFEQQFLGFYAQYTQLLQISSQPAPPNVNGVLNLTVGEFNAVLDQMQAALIAIPGQTLEQILNNSAYDNLIMGDARDFLIDLESENYGAAFELFDASRDLVSGSSAGTLMSAAITAGLEAGDDDDDNGGGGDNGGGDNGGDTGGGDTGGGDTGGGDTGGGDTGGGDTGGNAELDQAVGQFQARFEALFWFQSNGGFSSQTYTIDDDTGAWQNNGGSSSGATLDSLFEELGEAAALAIMAHIGANSALVDSLASDGVDAADLEAAVTAATASARAAFEKLQSLGADLGDAEAAQPADPGAQAAAAMQDIIDSLVTLLPALDGELDALVFGSRNSDPSFVVSFEPNVNGTAHGDWMFLTDGADTFAGAGGDDLVFGMDGADSLFGGADSDLLYGGKGDDNVEGGTGEDTAGFSGAMGRYTIQMSSDGSLTVEDRASGEDGTDNLTGVENLVFEEGTSIFDDGILDLSIIQGITGLSESDVATFIELYIAYFDRAPDALGLYFWGSAFANGTTLEASAALFLDQDETRETYPADLSNLDFANQVYSNVLGRAADEAGRDFWVGQLDSGGVDRGTFILEVLNGAKADPMPGASQEFIDLQNGDREYLADKTDIGTYFSAIKGLSDVDQASAAMQLYVRGDESSIQDAIARIDADAAAAEADDSGVLLLQLVGVADDPFAV